MAFTRPKAAQIDFDVTNISDPLIRLNSAETGSADKDVGIVIERGDDTNVAIIYDESANEFAVINTTETGTTSGNVTIASYADIRAGAATFAGNITAPSGVFSTTSGTLDVRLTHDGGTNGYIGTQSNHPLIIMSNATAAITIDTSQNATFASNVDVTGGLTVTNNTSIQKASTATYSATAIFEGLELKNTNPTVNAGIAIEFDLGTDAQAAISAVRPSNNNSILYFQTEQGGTLGTVLTLDNAGAATFAGAIAMGTNKITGMGDPTSAQDAATKAYVDSQSSGGGGGVSTGKSIAMAIVFG
jgi:hypothetical protein